MKDPIHDFIVLSEGLWNERKALNHTHLPSHGIKRMRKIVDKLKKINLEEEINILEEIYVTPKSKRGRV